MGVGFWELQNSGWEPLKASQHACVALLGAPSQPFGNMSLRGVEAAGGAWVVEGGAVVGGGDNEASRSVPRTSVAFLLEKQTTWSK